MTASACERRRGYAIVAKVWCFVFVALSGPLIPHLRRSPRLGRFLDGLNVASPALMAVVTWSLGRAAQVDAWAMLLLLASAALLLRYMVNSESPVLGGGVLGNLIQWMR